MLYNSKTKKIEFTLNDKKILKKIIIEFQEPAKQKLPQLGVYKEKNFDVWINLVEQACVIGNARMLDTLKNDTELYKNFVDDTSLKVITKYKEKIERVKYLDSKLQEYKATRFHYKQAEKLIEFLYEPQIYKSNKFVIFNEIKQNKNPLEIRERLIASSKSFKLKSISDFMISVGISDDVIAFDTRLIGVLNEFFDFNLKIDQIQGNKIRYLEIEISFRKEICQPNNISLAIIDRILFNFSTISALEYFISKEITQ